MNIEQKALELYATGRTFNPDSLPKSITEMVEMEINAYIKGATDTLESLSSDTRTLEEVLDKYIETDESDSIDLKDSIIKTMQEVERMARAKGSGELGRAVKKFGELVAKKTEHIAFLDEQLKYKMSNIDGLNEQIQSLQQQLADMVKNGFIEKSKLRKEIRDQHNNNVKVLSERNVELADQILSLQQQLSMKEDDHTHTVLELKQQLADMKSDFIKAEAGWFEIEKTNVTLNEQLSEKDKIAYDLSVEFAEAMNALKKENQSLKDRLKAISEKATEIGNEVEKVKALEAENQRRSMS